MQLFEPQMIAVGILGALGFYGALQYFRRRSSRPSELVNWSPLEAVGITIGIYFVSQFAAAIGIGLFGSVLGKSGPELESLFEGTIPQFVFILTVEAVTVGLLYLFMKRRSTPWGAIGWVRPKLQDIWYTGAGFGVYFVLYGIVISQLVDKYLPIDTNQQQELGFDKNVVGPELIFIFLSLVILPPLIEEILVRGFLFTGLKNKLNLPLAMIVTSVVFAAAHLQWGSDAPLLWTAAIDTFVLSMVLVYVRWRSKSLWPGIGIHFLKNGLAFLALFVFKVV